MTGSGVESPSHWISRESGSTPLGRLTLQFSVYEVQATPDPSPDTTTTGGATGGATGATVIRSSYTFTVVRLVGACVYENYNDVTVMKVIDAFKLYLPIPM